MDDRVTDGVQEGLIDPQQLAVAGSAAEQTAQDITPALVRGKDTVTDHKGGGTDVVGDNSK